MKYILNILFLIGVITFFNNIYANDISEETTDLELLKNIEDHYEDNSVVINEILENLELLEHLELLEQLDIIDDFVYINDLEEDE